MIQMLTWREKECCRLIALSKNSREIAAFLRVSKSTIKGDIASIISKTGVPDRVGVAVMWARHTLVGQVAIRTGKKCARLTPL